MKKPLIINIVSGKGGTGKSLLCAVLGRLLGQEGGRVLLVDLDIYVRGLTHFFYFFKKEKREITEALTIADFFGLSSKNIEKTSLARERFYEVDLLPSVSEIEEQINYLKVGKEKILKTKELITCLRELEYDYILIDNRAGVDIMILESCRLSDLIISISEDDPIARSTNENLLRNLKSKKVGKVYTVFNKIKYVKSKVDYLEEMKKIRGDFEVLGKIPFDIDLFEAFGSLSFWENINSSSYAFAVAEAWNNMAKRESLWHTISRDTFLSQKIWKTAKKAPTFLTLIERVSLMMGSISIAAYFIYDFIKYREFAYEKIFIIYAILFFLFPVFRRLLRSNKE